MKERALSLLRNYLVNPQASFRRDQTHTIFKLHGPLPRLRTNNYHGSSKYQKYIYSL